MNKKIDIFVAHYTREHGRYFAYACSTLQAATCREAREKYYWLAFPKVGRHDIKAVLARGQNE